MNTKSYRKNECNFYKRKQYFKTQIIVFNCKVLIFPYSSTNNLQDIIT